MPRTLYIATTNAGKLHDFAFAAAAGAAASSACCLVPLAGMQGLPVPVEDAPDFAGNARIKAIAYSLHLPGQMVLADDSGLAVDALGGAPGVYSARYAARENFPNPQSLSTDALNNACLLDRLAGVPAGKRTARYHCVLTAAVDGVVLASADGTLEGVLLGEPRGSSGFGYDPLFLLPASQQTMAEVDAPARLLLSHRGRALASLLTHLR